MGARERKLTPEQQQAKDQLGYFWTGYLMAKDNMELSRDKCVELGVPFNQMGKVMGVTEASVRQMYKRRSERGPSLD